MNKEELYELYIIQNHSRTYLEEYYGISRSKLYSYIKKYNLIKSKEKQLESFKQTNLDKLGVEYPLQSKEIQYKCQSTIKHKYGDKYFKTIDFKNKRGNIQDRINQTNLERLENSFKLENKIKPKIINWLNSLHIQIEEPKNIKYNNYYNIYPLLTKLGRVKKNYKCDRLPYRVDYYIPSLDLFIDFHNFIGHGPHPFSFSKEDISLLMYWVEQADKKPLDKRNKYLSYILTWIENDPIKRGIVKKNELNYLEFFTLDQFNEWYFSFFESFFEKK